MIFKYKRKYMNHISICGIFVIILSSLFYLYDYLLQTSISIFLPIIKVKYMITDFQLGLIGAIFFASYVILQVPIGYLIGKYGARRITSSMAIICFIGGLIMASGEGFYSLLLSRLILGIGVSGAFLCSIKFIYEWAPNQYFSFFIGILQALAGFGAIAGQAPIAFLNNYFSWNNIIYGFAIISFIFFLVFKFLISQDKSVLSSSQDNMPLLSSMKPLIKDKVILKLAALSFISWAPVASLAGFWIIPFLSSNGQNNTLVASYITSSFWIGLILGSILIPLCSEQLKRRLPVLVISFLLQFLAFLLICTFGSTDKYTILLSMFSIGLVAPIQGFCIVVAKDIYPVKQFNIISGFLNMFATLGGGVLQLVIGFLLSYIFTNNKDAYQLSFVTYSLLALIGLLISFYFFKETHPEYNQIKRFNYSLNNL